MHVYLAIGGAAQNASASEGDDIATTMLMETAATAPANKQRKEEGAGKKAVKKGKRACGYTEKLRLGSSAPTFPNVPAFVIGRASEGTTFRPSLTAAITHCAGRVV